MGDRISRRPPNTPSRGKLVNAHAQTYILVNNILDMHDPVAIEMACRNTPGQIYDWLEEQLCVLGLTQGSAIDVGVEKLRAAPGNLKSTSGQLQFFLTVLTSFSELSQASFGLVQYVVSAMSCALHPNRSHTPTLAKLPRDSPPCLSRSKSRLCS